MALLNVQNISHLYFTNEQATTALDDVSLKVEEGEFISFLGPSGCGKTTLLSIISGLLSPSDGSVTIEGQPLKNFSRKTGYMLQQDYLFPWKTIEQNSLIGLKLLNKLTAENKHYAAYLLKEMGLSDVKTYFPSQLSGGMRQRAALVRTLATDPKLLLLDEPFSALDYQTKLKLENLVFQTLKEHEKTAILVTHDISEAIAMSDRIFLFSHRPGKVKTIFQVPESLTKLNPFDARQHHDFSCLFQKIWKELESLE
ncbi:ABC transporter ATP-binding protein [Bacillus taeanensis]|uniref:Spermidine/putrescine ABC transporter ATP-binding protein n=1 Tax=Bacillus taeanensis TaxID=273032 RepID=A0A366XYA0_9BACI|nr:ABC transporter ATP-binding protein [Bacillus taeanensis]RBW71390.1 spermidine/putrescine ABC transporter ATP-binding protein [Bacillus taeanensis]